MIDFERSVICVLGDAVTHANVLMLSVKAIVPENLMIVDFKNGYSAV